MKAKTLIIGALTTAAVIVVGFSATQIIQIQLNDNFIKENLSRMNDEQKKAHAAEILDTKCGLCHGLNATAPEPLNALSLGLMERDVLGAQRAYVLSDQKELRNTKVDALKLRRVIDTGRMPVPAYKLAHWSSVISDADKELFDDIYPNTSPFEPIADPAPVANLTEAAKITLGHILFADKRLSSDNTVSCASCHDLTKGGTDNLAKSEGVYKDGKPQFGGVNAPTVYNAAGHISQFWDGRASDLQEQAGGPPLNPVEMGYSTADDWAKIAAKLQLDAAIVGLFEQVYGDQSITAERITDAIAAFEKTLSTPNSAFDLYLKGDKKALSDSQIAGMEVFKASGCASCHAGPAMGGLSFEYIHTFGDMRQHLTDSSVDTARGRADFSKKAEHTDMFRVPTLRNVALSAPYFHTGKVEKLYDAVNLMFDTQFDGTVSEQSLKEVTSFLEAQTGQYKGKPLDQLSAEEVAPAPAPAPTAVQ